MADDHRNPRGPPGTFQRSYSRNQGTNQSNNTNGDWIQAPAPRNPSVSISFMPQEASPYNFQGPSAQQSAIPNSFMPQGFSQNSLQGSMTQRTMTPSSFMSQDASQYPSAATSTYQPYTTGSKPYNMAPSYQSNTMPPPGPPGFQGQQGFTRSALSTPHGLGGQQGFTRPGLLAPPGVGYQQGFNHSGLPAPPALGYQQSFNRSVTPAPPALGYQQSFSRSVTPAPPALGYQQGFSRSVTPALPSLGHQQGFNRSITPAPLGFGGQQNFNYPVQYSNNYLPASNTAQGSTQVTSGFRSNDYYHGSAGPSNFSTHGPSSMQTYAPLPYDAGPMEDFSSRPPVPADEVQRRLAERAGHHSRLNDASSFRPMKRVLLDQGGQVEELHGPAQPLGKAAGPKVPDDVNCCIYMEGLHPETTYADLFMALRGKILRTHITPPNGIHATAAAKVGFFRRYDALRTWNTIKAGRMYIKDHQVRIVKWNWDGYTEDQIEHNINVHSRVLIIKGPRHTMNMEYFETLFRSKIFYDLESRFEVPCNEEGMTRFEWRFGSVPNQAQAAKWIIEREPMFADGPFEVNFGPDPCDVA